MSPHEPKRAPVHPISHPENDLHSSADYHNKPRPEPRTIEEFAEQPDPALVNARNQASTRQAVWFGVATVVGTVLFALFVASLGRIAGGPLCDAGEAVWLCSQTWRNWWSILCSFPPVIMLLACAVIMVRKLNRYERWVPWMGVFWIPIVPFTIFWLMITLGMIASDYA